MRARTARPHRPRRLLQLTRRPLRCAARAILRGLRPPREPARDVDLRTRLRRRSSGVSATATTSGDVEPCHPRQAPRRCVEEPSAIGGVQSAVGVDTPPFDAGQQAEATAA